MNWRLSALDSYTMVSIQTRIRPQPCARSKPLSIRTGYPAIAAALQNHDTDEFYGTLEFFPSKKGKYHNDGHRNCKICLTPEETIAAEMPGLRAADHRWRAAPRSGTFRRARLHPGTAYSTLSIVPLPRGRRLVHEDATASKKSKRQPHEDIIKELGPELFILRDAPLEETSAAGGPNWEGIRRLVLPMKWKSILL